MLPSQEPSPPFEPLPDTAQECSQPVNQEATPEAPPPPVGTTPAAELVVAAAQDKRGAAWRLLHWIGEDNPEALEAIRSFPDQRLLERLLEWLALGTWAGKSFRVPSTLRQPHVRNKVRTLFLLVAPEGVSQRVLLAGLRDARPALRAEAAQVLGILGDPATTPALLDALRDTVPEVRLQAAKALGRLQQPEAAPALVAALGTHDEALAGQVHAVLAQMGEAAIPPLLEAARSSDAWVRWHALRVLGEFHDQRALPVLVQALADSDYAVAWVSARALAAMGTPAVRPILHLLITAPLTPWLMETAAYALRYQHNRQLRPFLAPVIRAMHSTDYRIQVPLAVEHALATLPGG
jgi:hypothetical protein